MAIGRVMAGVNCIAFDEFYGLFENRLKRYDDDWDFELFLQIPNITKADILEYFENNFLGTIMGDSCEFSDVRFPLFFAKSENLANSIQPNYNSENVSIIGQLFLAGYIDFGSYYDDKDRDRIDYPTNLSYWKEDKYQAWIYFRDNFFYKNAFGKNCDEDILIYEGKEYTRENCPSYINKEGNPVLCGYSTMFGETSWDTPKYWSQYNIWVARTKKGSKYLEEILEPRFYNKYKDLSVEIDDNGNIIRWIGGINR
ncbi:hypothetical protein BKN38_04000 [Helicobacter sp. CLO-3]|uniref:hypothetical protein n=1 Tax=unclassified Helicobacter TaxID=2593540 RepID=UPI0008047B03|nr:MULTISPECIES: hypothetical protein [unclassified Helicobacter]OBV29572.1 hypothetical protein BA723_04900 [Helicobacter sp. CLO-3]OHU84080.1 hypothetical protein BKN38_04000 [Helicobacter sp. CLO-3]